MAYDEDLADRIRELLGAQPGLTETKMFGGLAFLVGGNMAIAASGQGGLLVRADPATSDRIVATTKARPMEMGGRAMNSWLRVAPEDVRTKRQLAKWVEMGTNYARSLPPKAARTPKPAAGTSKAAAGPSKAAAGPSKPAARKRT
jgi:TfoX/Sxy family transcriptional regulator of competence genes